jgi:DEAD/DEAH box helicase domain-containing protein
MTSFPANPVNVYNSLKDAYLRYVDTQYWLSDESMLAERRRLLLQDGQLFTEPLLEPVLPYEAAVELAPIMAELGISPRTAEVVGTALFGAYTPAGQAIRVRDHQATALRANLQTSSNDGRNIVVTSGTGSGKTESFLLPVLTRLVEENLAIPPSSIHKWWDGSTRPRDWRNVRSTGRRTEAIRAMVLYPTNALVEDQISRLRKAIWKIHDLGGPQLWFGRYTGSTPGSEERTATSIGRLAGELRSMVADFDDLQAGGLSFDVLSQFPHPGRGEMITRWDMIEAPPDILVTNYSMLNVVLMREAEDQIFAKTKAWLDQDPLHVFIKEGLPFILR